MKRYSSNPFKETCLRKPTTCTVVYPIDRVLLRASLCSSRPRYVQKLCIRIGDYAVCDGAFFGALLTILRSAKVRHARRLPPFSFPKSMVILVVSLSLPYLLMLPRLLHPLCPFQQHARRLSGFTQISPAR